MRSAYSVGAWLNPGQTYSYGVHASRRVVRMSLQPRAGHLIERDQIMVEELDGKRVLRQWVPEPGTLTQLDPMADDLRISNDADVEVHVVVEYMS